MWISALAVLIPMFAKSPHFWRWIAIFQKSYINRDIIGKNRQFQRFHRYMLAWLIMRFYRDKIVDFHSNLFIANMTGKWMESFMFSSHQISSSTCLRDEPLALSYSLFFNRQYSSPFDSILSSEQETKLTTHIVRFFSVCLSFSQRSHKER